jgi:hypothetical protein
MKTTSLLATTLLTLSLAPALQAQGYTPQPDRYQPRDQYQPRPDEGRVRVLYPDAGHLDRVSALAHEIDETATWTYREFTRNNRRPNRYEYRAMSSLRDLNVRAAHFHDEIEGYRQNPRHTADDFARLERSFYAASDALARIQPRPYVDRGMQRIYGQMSELSAFYGRRAGTYGNWGDHDRDGRGHDGRDNDGRDHRDSDRHDNGDRDQDHNDHDNGYRPPYQR